MTLKEMEVGQWARVLRVGGTGALRQHILDMGVIPGTVVYLAKLAPLGDPMELRVHGYALSMRKADAAMIEVEPAEAERRVEPPAEPHEDEHPGLGEGGRYHDKAHESALPKETVLRFALAGNQNCGKTTLFNQLTGSNQHVGNFPGVTVDRKDGVIRHHPGTQITDLPGIYSLAPYTSEEIVSRDFILRQHPHAIINIVDATNIERNLYLSMQLLEMNMPMVIALNMMDEFSGNHGAVDINGMEELLGVPVIPISAAKNEGVDELVSHAIHIAKYQERPEKQDLCSPEDHDGAVHRAIHTVESLIEDHAFRAGLPLRFAATKVIENDELILKQLKLDKNEEETIEHVIIQMEKESGMDRSAAIADMRFDFIERVCEQTIIKPKESKERIRSEKIDQILTGKWTAIPCFILIMGAVFILTFNVIGAFFQGILESAIDVLTGYAEVFMDSVHVNDTIRSLISEGIFQGVGSVLSFFPIVVTLFFFLSLMEDSGYIARVAFFMDKLLRKIGLSGRSIVPMLIGFGCTVPAVMSTRTLPSARDRKMTILLTPFMSCTAKLPIYGFFIDAFFPKSAWWIMTALYVLGIAVSILVALLFKKTLFKGEAVPFVMELPNYRMPSARNVAQLLWEKAKDFLQRAFSVILIATIAVWFLQSFDFGFNLVDDTHNSILANIASLLVPIMRPLGMGDWRIVTSLVCGFMAKESVVSTMQMLFAPEGVAASISALTAAGMLVFSLLYTPCVAAMAAIRRELGRQWALYVVLWQCGIAWVMAFAVRLIGQLLLR